MAADPVFASTPRHEAVSVSSTADTSRTAPSTYVTLLTAGSSGTKIESLVFEGTGTTVAGVVVVFIYDGSTYHDFYEEAVTAVTASTTAAAYRTERTFDNLILKAGESLRVTSQVASQLIKVHAFGGDF
jgi:hypothetical protein